MPLYGGIKAAGEFYDATAQGEKDSMRDENLRTYQPFLGFDRGYCHVSSLRRVDRPTNA